MIVNFVRNAFEPRGFVGCFEHSGGYSPMAAAFERYNRGSGSEVEFEGPSMSVGDFVVVEATAFPLPHEVHEVMASGFQLRRDLVWSVARGKVIEGPTCWNCGRIKLLRSGLCSGCGRFDLVPGTIDIHRATAAAALGIDPKDVTEEQRREAKAVNLAGLYGGAADVATWPLRTPVDDGKRPVENPDLQVEPGAACASLARMDPAAAKHFSREFLDDLEGSIQQDEDDSGWEDSY